MNLIARMLFAGVVALASGMTLAQPAEAPKVEFPVLGKLAPRSARQIQSSNWSVGGETLDRDYAIYPNYKQYLGPLGAKGLRVQCGWAKCEKQKGVYDFAWLDEVVNDSLAQGVQPWLEVSYGNTIYPDGGGIGLGDGIPTSGEALEAWDNWVRALVKRYKDRVKEWEVWNEPDLGRSKTNAADVFAGFFVRTAQVIRAEHPEGKIYALGLAGNMKYLEEFMVQIQEKQKLDLIDAVTVHGYPTNPDSTGTVSSARKIVAKYSPKIQVRQGETGAPSTSGTFGALRGHPWTELTQAKYDARRMLAHYASDVPFNLFTLMELHYKDKGGGVKVNTKGLLKSKDDKTVERAKPAYFAAQHVFALFDDTLTRIEDFPARGGPQNLVIHAYAKKDSKKQFVTLWLGGAIPSDKNDPAPIDLTLVKATFDEPVYIDLLSGTVYSIPKANFAKQANGTTTFQQIPVFDWPIVIAEKALIELKK